MDKRFPIYKKVLENTSNNQLYIIIDKKSRINVGEYVKVEVQE
jgi:hypothetical protein